MPLHLKGNAPRAGQVDRRYYMIDVQEGGRRVRISSGTRSLDLAERKQASVVAALRHDPEISKADLLALVRGELKASAIMRREPAPSAKPNSFGAIGQRVLNEVWRDTPNYSRVASNYKMVLTIIGEHTPITAVDRAAMVRLVEECKKIKNSPATINRKLSVVSAILDYAEDEQLIPHKPKVPRQSGERKRQFVFDEAEFDRMLQAVRERDERELTVAGGHPIKQDAEWYCRLFAVLYETGMRPGEAYQLRWDRIKFDRGIIEIRHDPKSGVRTKTGKSRTVPMTDRCRELLLEVWGKVKIGPFANLDHRRANDHWKGAREALGITDPDCVPYATRHSLATRLIEETGDLHQAKEWLGHSTIALTSNTYAHVRPKYLEKGMDALNDRRRSISETTDTRDSVTPCSEQSETATSEKLN